MVGIVGGIKSVDLPLHSLGMLFLISLFLNIVQILILKIYHYYLLLFESYVTVYNYYSTYKRLQQPVAYAGVGF